MNLFGQAKDLYKLQKQAKKIKKDLKNIHVEAEHNGVTIVINGEQEVMEVKISDELLHSDKKGELQKILVQAFNKGVKKAQEIAAEKMKDMMGGMGLDLPGLSDQS